MGGLRGDVFGQVLAMTSFVEGSTAVSVEFVLVAELTRPFFRPRCFQKWRGTKEADVADGSVADCKVLLLCSVAGAFSFHAVLYRLGGGVPLSGWGNWWAGSCPSSEVPPWAVQAITSAIHTKMLKARFFSDHFGTTDIVPGVACCGETHQWPLSLFSRRKWLFGSEMSRKWG